MAVVKRGDIFFADLKGADGSEQQGRRPVLIVQNNTGNTYAPTVICAAITTRIMKTCLPTHVRIPPRSGLLKESVILTEQLRTLDKNRLLEHIGSLSREEIYAVNRALKASLSVG